MPAQTLRIQRTASNHPVLELNNGTIWQVPADLGQMLIQTWEKGNEVKLEATIRRKGLSKEAFDRWSDLRDRLSEHHRFRLLVAWSRALISGQSQPFAEKVEQVIAEIETNEEGGRPLRYGYRNSTAITAETIQSRIPAT